MKRAYLTHLKHPVTETLAIVEFQNEAIVFYYPNFSLRLKAGGQNGPLGARVCLLVPA